MAKTIAGLFDDYNDAQAAVNELMKAGFGQRDISMVANNSDKRFAAGHSSNGGTPSGTAVVAGTAGGAVEGAALGGLTGLAAGVAALLLPGIGPIFAMGPLVAALSGAGMGAVGGGMIGGLAGLGISHDDSQFYAEGIRRGGTLIAVQADDDSRAAIVQTIFARHDAVDPAPRRQHFHATGFAGHDPDAAHWTPEQISDERRFYEGYPNLTALPEPFGSVNTPSGVSAIDNPEELMFEDEIASGSGSIARIAAPGVRISEGSF